MSQQPSRYTRGTGGSQSSAQSNRVKDSLYRSTLYNNGVSLDVTGRRIPDDLRTFVDEQILQQRSSPQLNDTDVALVFDTVEEITDTSEAVVKRLTQTAMFPFTRQGLLAEGGDSQWDTTALPRNPEYIYEIAAPKPDIHFGYPATQGSPWSTTQNNVLSHPVARPYAQPARGNSFPFLTVEIKSEATGGTLYVAENQAAGSGSHAVNALRWLFDQGSSRACDRPCTETIAFSLAISQREALLHVHWYGEADRRHYMSFLRSYSALSAADIRACNNTVKNIIDYGLGVRKTNLGAALETLFPYPENWKQAQSARSAPITPAPSSSGNASKRRRV
ncbi:hypothetical protein LTR12_002458 [Friedmanniomyces endolithicus]|nr:hypothetical protein LTR12_002458 [Friedmanniomyces endolithicus]